MAVNNNWSTQTIPSDDGVFPSFLHSPLLSPRCAQLYIKGFPPFQKRCVAIVGTRKASAFGKQFARRCAYELAARDFCIVSGLAYGIDEQAHRGALDAHGVTCAVLAHGLHTVCPEEHANLASDILLHSGSLVSEYEEGVPPLPYRYIERNRIISALCEAVLVVEAPKKSGAVHTGMYALKQKKRLFVLPGFTSSPLYVGSHTLIRAGGTLVASVENILSDLCVEATKKDFSSLIPEKFHDIIQCIRDGQYGLSVDTIAEHCTLKPQDVQAAISELLLQGMIIEDGIGRYRISNQH